MSPGKADAYFLLIMIAWLGLQVAAWAFLYGAGKLVRRVETPPATPEDCF